MATQDASSVPFSAAHTQQSFKLLELPDDLLALLESANPPLLSLHAPTPSSPALLTTPSTTYRLQQKNSSNPLMLLRPSTTAATFSSPDPVAIPSPSVCTIAKIEDTLELLPFSATEAAAAPAKPNKWHEKFAASRNAGRK